MLRYYADAKDKETHERILGQLLRIHFSDHPLTATVVRVDERHDVPIPGCLPAETRDAEAVYESDFKYGKRLSRTMHWPPRYLGLDEGKQLAGRVALATESGRKVQMVSVPEESSHSRIEDEINKPIRTLDFIRAVHERPDHLADLVERSQLPHERELGRQFAEHPDTPGGEDASFEQEVTVHKADNTDYHDQLTAPTRRVDLIIAEERNPPLYRHLEIKDETSTSALRKALEQSALTDALYWPDGDTARGVVFGATAHDTSERLPAETELLIEGLERAGTRIWTRISEEPPEFVCYADYIPWLSEGDIVYLPQHGISGVVLDATWGTSGVVYRMQTPDEEVLSVPQAELRQADESQFIEFVGSKRHTEPAVMP
jgi:hypothetical protein